MNIFKFEFKRGLKTMIYWTVATVAIIAMFMALFPSMSAMGDIISAKTNSIPPELLEALNFSETVDFSNIFDYSAYCFQYIAMAFAMYGGILGVSALIREEGEGTIEFLYSKPVSREKILWSKVFSSATLFLIYSVFVSFTTILMSMVVKNEGIEISELLRNMGNIFLGLTLLGYIFMAIGVMISSALKREKGATSMIVGLFFSTYIIGIASKLKESLDWMKYISPYEWVVPANIIKDGIEGKFIIIGVVIIIISLLIANYVYKKKDLNIN